MNSTVRISIALFIGYTAYLATAFLLGDRPGEVGDWVRLLIKGFLIVLVAISFVEWLAKRRNAEAVRISSQMSSESQVPQPTVSGPPTAG
ncbi:hypothetical protein [Nocardia anaemiae]|uniref:hypothetical protein n=1 Tax=Nocardia anaemiae TaxID=263910 RepID=UPI0012F50BC9|nr:hypothetical protein [Nocardia anaemiae]